MIYDSLSKPEIQESHPISPVLSPHSCLTKLILQAAIPTGTERPCRRQVSQHAKGGVEEAGCKIFSCALTVY